MRQSRLPTELLVAYLKTDYRVTTPHGEVTVKVGHCSLELDLYLDEINERHWAIITAYNPGSQLTSADINIAFQKHLLTELKALELKMLSTLAMSADDSWPAEPGVLIVGGARENARGIAIRYGQNAIIEGELGGSPELITLV